LDYEWKHVDAGKLLRAEVTCLSRSKIWRKRVGVEITVKLQIDRVYTALRTPAPLQSLLNITVKGAAGIEITVILQIAA
jgi:hypothetical protein